MLQADERVALRQRRQGGHFFDGGPVGRREARAVPGEIGGERLVHRPLLADVLHGVLGHAQATPPGERNAVVHGRQSEEREGAVAEPDLQPIGRDPLQRADLRGLFGVAEERRFVPVNDGAVDVEGSQCVDDRLQVS